MKHNKKALTLILVVGTILVAALPAASQGPPREGPPEERPMSLACIPDITAGQLEAIQKLRDEFHEATQSIRDELYEAKDNLRELLREPEPDLAAVRRAKENVDDLETEMLIARLEMHLAVRRLLTDEQRVFFDEMHAFDRGPGPGMGPSPGGPGMGSGPGMGPGMGPGPEGWMGH
jgi:Spy/CpxP family protein refolding chaperone